MIPPRAHVIAAILVLFAQAIVAPQPTSTSCTTGNVQPTSNAKYAPPPSQYRQGDNRDDRNDRDTYNRNGRDNNNDNRDTYNRNGRDDNRDNRNDYDRNGRDDDRRDRHDYDRNGRDDNRNTRNDYDRDDDRDANRYKRTTTTSNYRPTDSYDRGNQASQDSYSGRCTDGQASCKSSTSFTYCTDGVQRTYQCGSGQVCRNQNGGIRCVEGNPDSAGYTAPHSDNSICTSNESYCTGDNRYYTCQGGVYETRTCSSGMSCVLVQTSPYRRASCVRPTSTTSYAPSSSPSPTGEACTLQESYCTGPDRYYTCQGGFYQTRTCVSGASCRMVAMDPRRAACIPDSTSTSTSSSTQPTGGASCPRGQAFCITSRSYYNCESGTYQIKTCPNGQACTPDGSNISCDPIGTGSSVQAASLAQEEFGPLQVEV